MSDDIQLPTTVEEYQRDLRAAFTNGAVWRGAQDIGRNTPYVIATECEARKRYPIRTRRLREVALDPEGEVRANLVYGLDRIALTRSGMPFSVSGLSIDQVRALARLVENPYEEVEE